MNEIKLKGESVIRSDVLAKRHSLSGRQAKALEFMIEHGELAIQDFEKLYPEVTRRTLQRELKALVDLNLIKAIGSTHPSTYVLVAS